MISDEYEESVHQVCAIHRKIDRLKTELKSIKLRQSKLLVLKQQAIFKQQCTKDNVLRLLSAGPLSSNELQHLISAGVRAKKCIKLLQQILDELKKEMRILSTFENGRIVHAISTE